MLPMSDDEIRKSYREAKKPYDQVKILAQLNSCSEDVIGQILRGVQKPKEPSVYPETDGRKNKEVIAEREKRFQELYDQGLSDYQISSRTSFGPQTVCQWRHKNKLPPHARSQRKETFVVPKQGTPRKEYAEAGCVPDAAELGLPVPEPIPEPQTIMEAIKEGYEKLKLGMSESAEKSAFVWIKNPEASKPPLGLRPREVWLQERFDEIMDAISRYRVAHLEIPPKWIGEAFDLVVFTKTEEYNKENAE